MTKADRVQLATDCAVFINEDLRNLSLHSPVDLAIATALLSKWIEDREYDKE